MKSSLVIGIGNIGRADDGLGWAFANRLIEDDHFEVVYRYQLQVEDAELISRYNQVWIVDASHQYRSCGFECKKLMPGGRFLYTTHSLHPGAVLNLCHQVYHKTPEVHLLAISGEDFELGHRMSIAAKEHLEKAYTYFLQQHSVDK